MKSYPGTAKGVEHLRCSPAGGLDSELLGVLIELVDRPAVGPGHYHRLHDDRGEHLYKVQAGAHALTYRAEGLELVHFAGEFVSAAFQHRHEIDCANSQSRLRRESRENFHCAIAERIHLVSPQLEHADCFVVEQHRDTHYCPVAGRPLRIRSAVVRVHENVRNLRSPPVQHDPAGE